MTDPETLENPSDEEPLEPDDEEKKQIEWGDDPEDEMGYPGTLGS